MHHGSVHHLLYGKFTDKISGGYLVAAKILFSICQIVIFGIFVN